MAKYYARLTLFTRNTEGFKASLRARTQRQKDRLLAVSLKEAQEVFDLAQALANRDTNYMANHMVVEFSRGGFNWVVGFRREDFVGQVNPLLPGKDKVIRVFYPVFVVKGTRFYAGNDFLTQALRLRKQAIKDGYRKALGGR